MLLRRADNYCDDDYYLFPKFALFGQNKEDFSPVLSSQRRLGVFDFLFANKTMTGPFPRAAEAHASSRARGEGGGGCLQAVWGVCVGFR